MTKDLTIITVVGLAAIIAICIGAAFGCQAYGRYQKRADANNNVKVIEIQIKNQQQQIQVAKQQAEIKHQVAIGQKKANEEISKRLTPLFVQFEMIEALKAIAESGNNSSVIFIPSGANGVPLVSVANQPQVFEGNTKPSKGK